MVASMYLLRELHNAQTTSPVRLFEGFVSYKDKAIPSDHKRDVQLLREVIRDHVRFRHVFPAEQLKQDASDKLFSAFCVADMDCGVPVVIKRQV